MLNKLMKQYTINIMKSFENHELELRSKIERKFRIKRKTKKKLTLKPREQKWNLRERN